MRWTIVSAIGTLLLTATAVAAQPLNGDWRNILQERVRTYGHRNWIVIADSAYPAQSADGVETIVTGADHFAVLQSVIRALGSSKHVRPNIYTDRELAAIAESDAVGISAYRDQLSAFFSTLQLSNPPVQTLSHEKIIAKLSEVSRTFRVLILKTTMTLPYTSVFLELDCAYWGPDAERRLRSVLAAQSGR
jgi:L-fucose mutarotase/ribose pyranase (RbsD/FucU family)